MDLNLKHPLSLNEWRPFPEAKLATKIAMLTGNEAEIPLSIKEVEIPGDVAVVIGLNVGNYEETTDDKVPFARSKLYEIWYDNDEDREACINGWLPVLCVMPRNNEQEKEDKPPLTFVHVRNNAWA